MTQLSALLQQGNSWLFLPSAILLGALHGLEPGHSKTMMAAFIIAIRGTLAQAVLLALAATASHTAIVWIIALAGLYFGRQWNTETTEPYFRVISAVMIVAVAAWMLWRTARQQGQAAEILHDHAHHDEGRRIDTGHGVLRLQIFERGVPPRFRVYEDSGATTWPADDVRVETERSDGSREVFTFRKHGDYLESVQEIPEPRQFVARVRLGHEHPVHEYDLEFVEHTHQHAISDYRELDVTAPGYQDPHELAHANDIRHRFANRRVTTGQIIIFGLTGGLIPCPASVTVLLLCLQLRKLTLGATLVLCFSIGLALTLVASGAIAALGVKHASRHFAGFAEFARKAPYLSGTLILLVGLYVGYQGLRALT
jgi:nickel/cobalt exporter